LGLGKQLGTQEVLDESRALWTSPKWVWEVGGFMGLRINTNVASLNAQRNLGTQQQRNEHALAALSSGSRIVRASDDAAGLAISEHIRGETRGLAMARNNAFNAISLVEVSEGGLNEISNILIRLRELGVQSASDTISDKERAYIENEAKQLTSEADRIAKTTQFGSKKLLDGSGEKLEFQVGAFGDKDNRINYNINADATSSNVGYDDLSFGERDDARDSLGKIDKALDKISKMRADFGAVQSRLQSTVNNLDVQHENLSAAGSRIHDADVAHESAEIAQSQVLQSAAISVLAQANQSSNGALKLIQ
jgi:flagellin